MGDFRGCAKKFSKFSLNEIFREQIECNLLMQVDDIISR